ncbi:LLM class flavin-dependent oxidoreductase [Rubrobacter tropicus]|uniref:LLM class flavin-dependent oxidoreductase n=1 Tax=Rubrobacter tropicus TaxID=2653851 RepID=A0A6G8Q809_9ACTN|nr:LLM class flavin-dependent oxidoreductase [Rubrobacter tropicus]QIN82568.1 LLM class flavin-dependent oxidoreductase [Rubrobacter tropicus]
MPDYGRALEFGVSVEPLADPPDFAARMATTADRAGLDLVGIQDHPYQRRFLDTWTLISTLVPVTGNVRFFTDVANLPLRPPVMLAKAAASLDAISGGRVEVGLGAGAFWDAVVGMGGPRRSPGEALRSTEEAIEVMRMVWSGERSLRFEGEFYSLKGMRPGPPPAHDIGIWVGAYGPRMLGLIGRKADGWVPSLGFSPPGRLPGMHEKIDEGAAEAGRDPSGIKRVYNVSGNIGPEGEGRLEGSAEKWIETLAGFVLEYGMDTFVYWPNRDHGRQVELFANEVVPGVREAVARERGAGLNS